MTVQAQIRFRQGVSVGNPGEAFFGVLSTPVIIENVNNLGVENWSFEILDIPTGSVVLKGLVQDRGVNPTYSFAPDVRGGYLCKLTVRDKFGNVSEDVREFGVLRVSGRHIPSFLAIDKMLNYAGNLRGWAKFLDEWLTFLDGLGGSITLAGDVTGSAGSNVVERINGATVPTAGALTTGHLPKVSGVSALSYGFLVDTNVDAAAAIAGSKINPTFGAQTVSTTTGVTSPSLDRANAGALALGGVNATSIEIGNSAAPTEVKSSTLKWGTTNRGTEAAEITFTTNSATVNQTPVEGLIAQPDNTAYRYGISFAAYDTVADGGLTADWVETYQRRGGGAVSKTSSPSLKDADKWGTMSAASANVVASGDDVQVRVSPDTVNLVRWTLIVERVRRGSAA